jgi:chromosome segregation protein
MTDQASLSAPLLTRLEAQGFKSFATKTSFVFERGITAIIGPNGSGKSNIADAVRWALGEQSYGTLRGKKTDDVIFAGGQGKAPAGMAEVTLTFDNSTGWLPSDYTEVTVTRRAYRGGENQYLINGRKVRLKDVQILTASLGSSHVVVGQGLVDAALSQRAEERMALFEHAADLTGLRIKATEAARNLAETEANSSRIRDVLTEVEPRLKSLERAARQSQEYIGLRERRRGLQWRLERELLGEALAAWTAAQRAASGDEAALESARQRLDDSGAALIAARRAAEDARAALDQQSARAQEFADRSRRIGHERDLTDERIAALTRRREDFSETEAGLTGQQQALSTELDELATTIAAIDAEIGTARAAATDVESAIAQRRTATYEIERRAGELNRTVQEGERRQNDLIRQRALRRQRLDTDQESLERLTTDTGERTGRIERFESEFAGLIEADRAEAARLAQLADALTGQAEAEQRAIHAERAARERIDTAERRLSQVTARLDALTRLHESGAGLYQGVRTVQLAAKQGLLTGIRGPIVELIETPAQFETAIEVALGGHLQDIVVERWADAELAITLLKQERAGRATFQPLDTVRGRRDTQLPAEIGRMTGVHGIAAGLIGFDPELDPVVWSLLGRTLVVDDLATTRAALNALPGGWSVVTLAGEIARSSGAVTGGAAVKESGMLGRERELRELPAERDRAAKERDAAVVARQSARDDLAELATARRTHETEQHRLQAARKERTAQQSRIERWLADLRAEQTSIGKREAALTDAIAAAASELAALDARIAESESAVTAARTELMELQESLHADTGAIRAIEQDLAGRRQVLAGLDERLRGERRREANLRAQRQALIDERALRAERMAAVDGELSALTTQRKRLDREFLDLSTAGERVGAERPPLEQSLAAAMQAVARAEKEQDAAREAVLGTERQHGARALHLERTHGELRTIEQRIRDDLELEDPALLLENEPIPIVGAIPETRAEMEREITRLRDRMKRVGYAGENAVEEYEKEAARHSFLLTQLDDVDGASAALRSALADLHATMRDRFDATFARVSVVFSEMFGTLFGGGSARLVVVGGEEGETAGIDIVAQPPGKRLQSLALLSGGERSLTAVALLFAILKVNPTPFCLLDEVDAALDEANIVRFREELRRLARETQAIVITHNRGTTEIADALYGVSMRDDGVSQVLSLRLAPEDRATGD